MILFNHVDDFDTIVEKNIFFIDLSLNSRYFPNIFEFMPRVRIKINVFFGIVATYVEPETSNSRL